VVIDPELLTTRATLTDIRRAAQRAAL